MEVKNYRELADDIDYNNYRVGINTNLNRRQPNQIHALNTQTRYKPPSFTKIKAPFKNKTNDMIHNNSFQRSRTNNRYISSNIQRLDENIQPFKSSSSNNNLLNNKNINFQSNINDQNNYSINYTMRDSNYSLFSGSAFSTLTYNDLHSKYNYYKVLFHQLKGHNLALLNQIKKDKDLNAIIKSLEQEKR